MKATSIVMAICFGIGASAQCQGQEYFDGPGYLTNDLGQQAYAQQGYAQAIYAQADYQQIQQAHLAPAQQPEFAQAHPAQQPHVAPAQFTQSPYQQAVAVQSSYAQSQSLDYDAASRVEPYTATYQYSDSRAPTECADCVFDQHSTPSRLAGAYAGYSFAFTKLYMKESFEAYLLDFTNNTQTLIPFDYDYKLTPRVWIGARNQRGVGARVSYWNFDQSSNGFQFTNNFGSPVPVAVATSVIFPAAISGSFPGDTLAVASAVEANTLDFEGTYTSKLGAMEIEISGGIRYARSEQTSSATVNRVIDPFFAPPFSSLNWHRRFEGWGPVLNATGKLPMGNRGFYGVGGAGLSFLFGEKTLRRSVQDDATPFPNTGLPFLNFEEADEISGIYNVRIGLGHKRKTILGNAFVEGTYEGQLWTDLGAPTLTFAGFNSFNLNLGLDF